MRETEMFTNCCSL